MYRVGETPGGPASYKRNDVAAPGGTQVMTGLPIGDGFIDVADRDALRQAIGSCAGDPRYAALANLDGDQCVTQADYRARPQIFARP